MLRKLVVWGELIVVDPGGRAHRFRGAQPGPELTVRLRDRRLIPRLLLRPSLALGEGYMDGRVVVERGSLEQLLELCIGASAVASAPRKWPAQPRWRPHANPVGRARRQAAHHYDLSDALFERFLDADRQYSCAYFPEPGMDLERAQEAKKELVATKLRLSDGLRVLDIGSGWGGLALHLARRADVQVTGVTLSEQQLHVSRRRAAEAGLADRVRFELLDYRQLRHRFDRIVSVGMFEHVGLRHYPEFFRTVRDLLTERGIALVHSIGRAQPPRPLDPWLRKYIFPGAYIPALSEVLPAIEQSGLWTTDVEVLRLHYAETLKHWRNRFAACRPEIVELYDEHFCRMWEFYLAASEAAFRAGRMMVFQAQLARCIRAVPLTRDYLLGGTQPVAQAGQRAA